MEKLSSGYRINHAADDAAGLAISEKMRTQVNGYDQASKNIQDGLSAYQTAEGGLEEIQSMLQRMRVLAIQSSNDTLTDADRQLIQLEVSELISEINRMITSVEFNNKKLLMPNPVDAASGGTVAAGTEVLVKTDTPGVMLGDINIDLDAAGITATQKIRLVIGFNGPAQFGIREIDINGNSPDSHSNASANFTAPENLYDGTVSGGGNISVNVTNCEATYNWNTIQNTDGGAGTDLTLANVLSDGGIQYWVYATQATTSANANSNPNDDLNTLHIGPNQNQTVEFNKPDLSNDKLGINSIDISTRTGAEASISVLDDAINDISEFRAVIGASMNRLEHSYNFVGIAKENIQSAESRIRDVDFASEMIQLTKNQIISQASQSMLSQANLQPQSVLGLIG